MARPTHPLAEVELAVQFAEANGWRYVPSHGHPWGRLMCPGAQRGACIISVWSTPRDAYVHAQQICRRVRICPH